MEVVTTILGLVVNKAGGAFLSGAGKYAADAILPKPPPSVKQKEVELLSPDFEYFELISPVINKDGSSIPLGLDAFNGLYGTDIQKMALLKYGHYFGSSYQTFCKSMNKKFHPQVQFVILYGPTGTGKTEHAKRLGKALGYYVLNVEPANLKGSGLDETSSRLKKLQKEYLRKEMFVNAVVLFDEFEHFLVDSFAQSQFRTFIEGNLKDLDCRILVIGTTNKIKSIPTDILSRAELIEFSIPVVRKPFEQFWRHHASSAYVRLIKVPDPRWYQWRLTRTQFRDLLFEKLVTESATCSFRTLHQVVKITNLAWFHYGNENFPSLKEHLTILRKMKKQERLLAKL